MGQSPCEAAAIGSPTSAAAAASVRSITIGSDSPLSATIFSGMRVAQSSVVLRSSVGGTALERRGHDGPLHRPEVLPGGGQEELLRAPGTAGSRRRPRSCAAGSRARRPRAGALVALAAALDHEHGRRAAPLGATSRRAPGAGPWYLGGGTISWTRVLMVATGSRSGEQEGELPARAASAGGSGAAGRTAPAGRGGPLHRVQGVLR